MPCEPCNEFAAKGYRCTKTSHGECDCPKCQGFCECDTRGEIDTENLRLAVVEQMKDKSPTVAQLFGSKGIK